MSDAQSSAAAAVLASGPTTSRSSVRLVRAISRSVTTGCKPSNSLGWAERIPAQRARRDLNAQARCRYRRHIARVRRFGERLRALPRRATDGGVQTRLRGLRTRGNDGGDGRRGCRLGEAYRWAKAAATSVLTASICRLIEPVTSSILCSTAATRDLSWLFSAARPRTACASRRVSASASNERAARQLRRIAWYERRRRRAATTASRPTRCAPTSLRLASTATRSAHDGGRCPTASAATRADMVKVFVAAAFLGAAVDGLRSTQHWLSLHGVLKRITANTSRFSPFEPVVPHRRQRFLLAESCR